LRGGREGGGGEGEEFTAAREVHHFSSARVSK
jgi:hypothetical protein